VVETATAWVFLLGAGFAALAFLRPRVPPRSFLWAGVAALGLLAFLDEYSFGQRLGWFIPPRVSGVRLDAAHDLLELGRVWLIRLSPSGRAILGLAGVAGVMLGGWCSLRLVQKYPDHSRRFLAPLSAEDRSLAAFFVGFIACAMLLDMHLPFLNEGQTQALEEPCELLAALSFTLLAWSPHRKAPPPATAISA
jgi:hypothetical protein